jgi:hypothetical protein
MRVSNCIFFPICSFSFLSLLSAWLSNPGQPSAALDLREVRRTLTHRKVMLHIPSLQPSTRYGSQRGKSRPK